MKGKRRYSKAKSSKFLKNKEVILENYEEDEGTVSIDRDEADKKQINFKKVKLTKFIKQKKTKKTVTKTKKSGPLKSYRVIINGATKKLERYKINSPDHSRLNTVSSNRKRRPRLSKKAFFRRRRKRPHSRSSQNGEQTTDEEDEKEYDDIRNTIINKLTEPHGKIKKLAKVQQKNYTKEKTTFAE